MDYAAATAEQVLDLVSRNENDQWEFKGAAYFRPDMRDRMRKEVATQTSAFGNSGGGTLIFGISDGRELEACPDRVSDTPTEDWLSDLIRASVSYTNRAYRVYGVPFANRADGRIFVIEYDDSPHAPHQSNSDQRYYYRVGHSSAPAPHFYVDLLSKRMTHAIVEIDRIRFSSGHCAQEADAVRIHYTVAIEGQNRSVQAATHWGIHFSSIDSHWRVVTGEGETLVGSGSVSGRRMPLLPKQSFSDRFELHGRIPFDANGNVAAAANTLFETLKIRCEGVSQNHAGNEYVLDPHNDPVINEAYYQPVRERRQGGKN